MSESNESTTQTSRDLGSYKSYYFLYYFASTMTTTAASIPTIDFSPFLEEDLGVAVNEEPTKSIDHACRKHGFFIIYIQNFGLTLAGPR
jgi:hypothetical protein